MTNESPALAVRSRADYRAWTRVSLRYNDLDPLGHVNNAAMANSVMKTDAAMLGARENRVIVSIVWKWSSGCVGFIERTA